MDGTGTSAEELQQERSLVLRQLARKVGNIPDGLQSQIDQLAIAQLEALGEALLDFGSILPVWLI